jgi:hypothetical protein
MKINSTFKVTFKVDKYLKTDPNIIQEGILKDKVEKLELEFELDNKTAGNFLFRFCPSVFNLNDYNVCIRYDKSFNLKNIILTKDNNIYIVTNTLELLSDIHEGYFRILTMNKINDIMEFDFNLEEDYDEIHEEFENEEEE